MVYQDVNQNVVGGKRRKRSAFYKLVVGCWLISHRKNIFLTTIKIVICLFLGYLCTKYINPLFSNSDKNSNVPSAVSENTHDFSFSTDIQFTLSGCNLDDESKVELDKIIYTAKAFTNSNIVIESNASERAPYVTDAEILDFTLRKAKAIEKYLTSKGIDSSRIVIINNGDFYPVNKENRTAKENRICKVYLQIESGGALHPHIFFNYFVK